MKALTIDAYWAWAIVFGDKRVENRSWPTNYRGPLLIHAGLNRSRDQQAVDWLSENAAMSLGGESDIESIRGAVIGVCNLSECQALGDFGCNERTHEYLGIPPFAPEFAFGPFGWFLTEVLPAAEPVKCKGKQRLWNPHPSIVRKVKQTIQPESPSLKR